MQWSRYNHLFRLRGNGGFLYNTLSNTLIELDDCHYSLIRGLKKGHGNLDPEDTEFTRFLTRKKVLVEPDEEKNLLLAHQYQRLATRFDSMSLVLTICPTLSCNFRCPYCFEKIQGAGASMDQKIMAQVIQFIRKFPDIRRLSVAWYGGEPLLAFDTIRMLTREFKALGITYKDASIVTNGYLMTKSIAAQFNDLMIQSIQITIDGPKEIHDSRRFLASGAPTYDRILENISTLFDSGYSGECNIRVNIDQTNKEDYNRIFTGLTEQFRGEKLRVDPGHVTSSLAHSYNPACTLNMRDWTKFIIDMYHTSGYAPLGDFHPVTNLNSVCTAGLHNGYIIGPEGELYKCWEDVGMTSMVIGNIAKDEPVTNPVLRAQYSAGADPFSDSECLACVVLPLCGGGCPNKRLRTKQFGEKGLEYCSSYKEHLKTLLELYIRNFRSRELCAEIVGISSPVSPGYRVISPQRRESQEGAGT